MKLNFFLLVLVVVACSGAIAVGTVPVDAAVKIAPMGDSITRGGLEPDSDFPSYRYHLWNLLRNGGYDVDFVGTTTEPNFTKFVFDQDHDGYSGYTTEELADDMDRILLRYTPDIVLLYIGTNDVMQQVPMDVRMSSMRRIVSALRQKNPNVRVLMALVSPTSDSFRNEYAELAKFNENLMAYAKSASTATSPLVIVDMNTAWSPQLFDQEDGIHPNTDGEIQLAQRWANALISTGLITPSQTTQPPTTSPTTSPPTPSPTTISGATYAQARVFYDSGSAAWSRAWGASHVALIRQYLVEAKTAYTNCLNTANAVNDPANAANLALVRTISTAYIALADAALGMYGGADTYGAGRAQMTSGDVGSAAASFQSAATQFDSSRTLFGQATGTLQSVVYAGTEYGDGTAYTAVIVPILNAKGAYMGEFATYAQGWQHTALAYQAGGRGDQATFRSEARQAINLFDSLRSSPAFGADARANSEVLESLMA